MAWRKHAGEKKPRRGGVVCGSDLLQARAGHQGLSGEAVLVDIAELVQHTHSLEVGVGDAQGFDYLCVGQPC